MATGSDSGVGGGRFEYYRVLVSGLAERSSKEQLVRTHLTGHLPGDIIDVHTQGTTNAVVTLKCQHGKCRSIDLQVQYTISNGSIWTIYNLGTITTTVVMDNIHENLTHKFSELADKHGVFFEKKTDKVFTLSGFIDNIYNLRTEVDTVLLHDVPQHPASPNPLANTATDEHSHLNMSPTGIPFHIRPTVSRSLSSPASSNPIGTGSSTENARPFKSKSPLRPSLLDKEAKPEEPSSVPTSSHVSITPPPTSSPNGLKTSNQKSTHTHPPPGFHPTDHDRPTGRGGSNDRPATLSGSTYVNTTHTEPRSPSLPDPPDTSADERPRVFSNLNPDALALVQKLSGEIHGIEYHVSEGSVHIQLEGECEAEEAITKFQCEYKKVVPRRLRTENVAIPATRSKEEVKTQIAKFEEMYTYCAFILDEEKRHVRVISQTRQFEQAKKFLEEALQKSLESSAAKISTTISDIVVVLSHNRTLTLKKSDISKEKADALVNAANGHLLHGGGVAGALNKASDGQLQKYSFKFMDTKRKGEEIPVGEVAVTHGGGSLQCFHVIHAVGPESTKHSPAESEHFVKCAVHNTLRAAERYNASSIALPALSCGIFDVSKDLMACSIIDTIISFKYSKPPPVLSDIRIVILDEPTHSCFARYFTQLEKQSHKSSVNDHRSEATPSKTPKDFGRKAASIEDEMLGVDDLPWIMTVLRQIAPKWKEILMKLGMHNDQIMSIVGQTTDHTVLLNMGISSWLQQASPAVTLSTLTAALSSLEVGEKQVASEIIKAGYQRKGRRVPDHGASHSNLVDLKYPELPQNATVGDTASRSGKKTEVARKDTNTKDVCPICLEHFILPVKTKCGHLFCKDCIEKSLQFDPYCPTCKTPLCAIFGKQPHGSTMTYSTLLYSLPGYEGYSTIRIDYIIPSGIQGQEHPNPRQRYHGTTRTAYLPDTQEGREVLLLLQKAFKARMIFTIGTSVTSGAENVVVWNDIHHKTNMTGGLECYGYPDPTYLQRVKEDLAAKGIVPDY